MSERVTENVSARVTPGEKDALDELIKLRAERLAEMGEPPDATFAGWLRAIIRREAKAANVAVVEKKGRKK
ncbi:MAG: hypothetical protein FJ034_08100 [Chloroflexi bacterium]|nr:hypothetical protein [Chloroflexota bacterium]